MEIKNPTNLVGSNMLDNMKHCVAIGGADDCAGCGVMADAGADTLTILSGSATPAEFIFRALTAYCGIWKPVPIEK